MSAVATSTEDGSAINIKARKGVVIATGAFENNEPILHNYAIKDFEGQVRTGPEGEILYIEAGYMNPWVHPEECDGAGIMAAMNIGAFIAAENVTKLEPWE